MQLNPQQNLEVGSKDSTFVRILESPPFLFWGFERSQASRCPSLAHELPATLMACHRCCWLPGYSLSRRCLANIPISLSVYALCSACLADKIHAVAKRVGGDGAGRKETCYMERLQGYLKAADWISRTGSPDAVHSGSAG